MKTAEIKEQFEGILADVMKIQGLPVEQATEVALTILRESGKYKRTEMLSQVRQSNGNSNGNGDKPATEKQKEALKKFRVSFSDNISKEEASKLLDEVIAKTNARKQ